MNKSFLLVLAFLLLAWNVEAQESPTPSPGLQAQASPVNQQQLSENDRRELEERRLTQSVQQRVLTNLAIYGTLLTIIAGLFGFIGFAAIRDAVTQRVEERIKVDIEKDVETFRQRIHETHADLHVTLADQKKITDTSRKQLEELQQRYSLLEDLGTKYEHLHGEVTQISRRVEEALTAAIESERKTETLRDAVASSFAGNPTVFSGNFFWDAGGGEVRGSNLGKTSGTLHLEFFVTKTSVVTKSENAFERLPEFNIEGDLIERWEDDYIKFRLSDEMKESLQQFRKKIYPHPVARSYVLRVTTAQGFTVTENMS